MSATTLLFKAIDQNRIDIVKWLIDNGVKIDSKRQHQTPLHVASIQRKGDVAKCLMEDGAPPLFCAIARRHVEIVKFLAENGAQLNKKYDSINGCTALHYAFDSGFERNTSYQNTLIEIAIFLIEKGAQPDAKNNFGNTPLHIAIWTLKCRQLEVVKFLVEKGACIDRKNNDNKTPLDLARKYNQDTIVEYLTLKQKEILNAATNEENISNKDPCIACSSPRNGFFILLPCAHASLCEMCCFKIIKEKFAKCPECRQPVKEYKKIFVSSK